MSGSVLVLPLEEQLEERRMAGEEVAQVGIVGQRDEVAMEAVVGAAVRFGIASEELAQARRLEARDGEIQRQLLERLAHAQEGIEILLADRAHPPAAARLVHHQAASGQAREHVAQAGARDAEDRGGGLLAQEAVVASERAGDEVIAQPPPSSSGAASCSWAAGGRGRRSMRQRPASSCVSTPLTPRRSSACRTGRVLQPWRDASSCSRSSAPPPSAASRRRRSISMRRTSVAMRASSACAAGDKVLTRLVDLVYDVTLCFDIVETSQTIMTTMSTAPRAQADPGAGSASLALARAAEGVIAGGVVSLNRRVEPNLAFNRPLGSAHLGSSTAASTSTTMAPFSPHLLGHNHPAISRAISQAIADGWSLIGSGTTPWEVALGERLRAGGAGCSKSCAMQLTTTGSEATAQAIRLARAATGRDHVVLTLGGYNGWHNDVSRAVAPSLDQVGPRRPGGEYPLVPASAGVPAATAGLLHVVGFNDLEAIERVLARHPAACVLTEPVLQNIGVLPPQPGYLAGVRAACDRHGAILVFDEVKTGFRSARGGYQSLCGVRPDLSVFGKAVAAGHPLGVIGGRADLMGLFHHPDPARRVLFAGTYNAHPIGVAAAIGTLDLIADGSVHRELEVLGAALAAGLARVFAKHGVPLALSRIGSAFCAYFMDHVPYDYHDLASHHDAALDARWRRELIARGIYLFPLPTKQGSISAAHTRADVDRTIAAADEALAAALARSET